MVGTLCKEINLVYAVLEKFSDNQLSESGFQVESKLGSWQVLDEFCGPKPYGPKDARVSCIPKCVF